MIKASVYWVNASEDQIHFVDAILSAYDGLANVRREWRLKDGQMLFKVYVAPGMEDEFEFVMQRLSRQAGIGEFFRGEDNELVESM
jgi:hypothetical protein